MLKERVSFWFGTSFAVRINWQKKCMTKPLKEAHRMANAIVLYVFNKY